MLYDCEKETSATVLKQCSYYYNFPDKYWSPWEEYVIYRYNRQGD